MARSPAYARIRSQILLLVDAIPAGRWRTYASIGQHLDVMPRHVAYILSQLTEHERLIHPWHRVVAADGSLGRVRKAPDGSTQAELLRAEGLILADASICGTDARIEAADLPSGLPPQQRPSP